MSPTCRGTYERPIIDGGDGMGVAANANQLVTLVVE